MDSGSEEDDYYYYSDEEEYFDDSGGEGQDSGLVDRGGGASAHSGPSGGSALPKFGRKTSEEEYRVLSFESLKRSSRPSLTTSRLY